MSAQDYIIPQTLTYKMVIMVATLGWGGGGERETYRVECFKSAAVTFMLMTMPLKNIPSLFLSAMGERH